MLDKEQLKSEFRAYLNEAKESVELRKPLDDIIDGSQYNIKLGYFVPSELEKMLKEIDNSIDLTDRIETNGWDLDFWVSFRYKQKQFTFAGSWYYGGYEIYRN